MAGLVRSPGIFASIGGGLAAAPTILDSILPFSGGASDPQVLSTSGLSWAVGQRILSFAVAASENISSITGDGGGGNADSGGTVISDVTANQSRLHFHEITVNGGALDANLSYDLTGARQIIASLLAVGGLVTITTPVENSGGSGTALPSSATFNVGVTVKNRLLLAVASIRGAHVTNPPVAPSTYTLLHQGATTTNSAASTLHHTLAVAYKLLPASSGSIPAAAWGGLSDAVTNNQPWATLHLALEPA